MRIEVPITIIALLATLCILIQSTRHWLRMRHESMQRRPWYSDQVIGEMIREVAQYQEPPQGQSRMFPARVEAIIEEEFKKADVLAEMHQVAAAAWKQYEE